MVILNPTKILNEQSSPHTVLQFRDKTWDLCFYNLLNEKFTAPCTRLSCYLHMKEDKHLN